MFTTPSREHIFPLVIQGTPLTAVPSAHVLPLGDPLREHCLAGHVDGQIDTADGPGGESKRGDEGGDGRSGGLKETPIPGTELWALRACGPVQGLKTDASGAKGAHGGSWHAGDHRREAPLAPPQPSHPPPHVKVCGFRAPPPLTQRKPEKGGGAQQVLGLSAR